MRLFKKILCVLSLLLVILALASCDAAPASTSAPEPQVFTVTYELMGGTYDGKTAYQVEVNENETVASIAPTKEGYQFAGWTKNPGAGDAPTYSFDQPVVEDTVIYAIWNAPELSLHTDGGIFPGTETGTAADYSFYLNHEDFILPTPEKPGFVFAGWYDSDTFGGDRIACIPQGSTQNYTLYAKWVPEGTVLPIVYGDHCVRNADGTTSAMPDKEAVYREFYSDFYNFIVQTRGAEAAMQSNAAKQHLTVDCVEDFLAIGNDYDAGLGDMVALAYIATGWFMGREVGGTLDGQSTWYFVGHCYQNGQHVALLEHLEKFFAYWRFDEGFTTPDNNGSDFCASPWASLVDTCKFFYFDENTSYVRSQRVLDCFRNIPGVFYPDRLELVTEFAVGQTTPLTRPTFDGYTFVGWYRELDGAPVDAISPAETEQVHLIGVWEKAE